MHANMGIGGFASFLPTENLLFARQPEPDLEFTEEDLTDAAPQAAPPAKSPKPSNKRPILWLLLLAVLGGLAYVAMEPDMVMRFLEPYLGDNEPTAARSVPPPQAKQSPGPSAPSNAGQDTRPTPTTSLPPTSTGAGAPPSATAGPLFAEGQKVAVVPDTAKPTSPVLLFADAARTKPGTSVAAGSFLTVLDGELQSSGWVYSVSTEDGRQGWIAENRLKFRR
ncbi:MAG TPA: hypothetical protein VJ805_15575 [Nitrospiraceae bacterium]|nr:hypothetical protein [Nitrospiraceae bacterium]